MISSTQREALSVLLELCELSDDIRLGQLLAHIGFLGEDQTGRTLWDIDDEQLLAALYHHRAEIMSRNASAAMPPLPLTVGAGPSAPTNAITPAGS